jgi:hypothetical protein
MQENPLSTGDGAFDSMDRGVHVRHEERIVKVFETGREKRPDVGFRFESPAQQQASDFRWDSEPRGQERQTVVRYRPREDPAPARRHSVAHPDHTSGSASSPISVRRAE